MEHFGKKTAMMARIPRSVERSRVNSLTYAFETERFQTEKDEITQSRIIRSQYVEFIAAIFLKFFFLIRLCAILYSYYLGLI